MYADRSSEILDLKKKKQKTKGISLPSMQTHSRFTRTYMVNICKASKPVFPRQSNK